MNFPERRSEEYHLRHKSLYKVLNGNDFYTNWDKYNSLIGINNCAVLNNMIIRKDTISV